MIKKKKEFRKCKSSKFGSQKLIKAKSVALSVNVNYADIFKLHSKRTREICSSSEKEKIENVYISNSMTTLLNVLPQRR